MNDVVCVMVNSKLAEKEEGRRMADNPKEF